MLSNRFWPLTAASAASRPSRRRPPLSAATLSQTALIGLFAMAIVAALWFTQAITVPITAAIVLGLVLGPFVDRLVRAGMPEFVAAGLVVALGLVAAQALLALCAFPLLTWVDRAPEIWEAIREKLAPLKSAVVELARLTSTVERATGLDSAGPKVAVAGPGVLGNVASFAPAVVAQFIIFVGTLFFYLASRRELHRGILGLCLSRRARFATARILTDSEYSLSRYFGAITLINLGLGAATAVLAMVFGLPSPTVWGALAAVLNFAPYVGAAVVTVVLFAVGLASLDTVWAAGLLSLSYVGLSTIEGQFVTPAVLGRHLTLNPLMIFIATAAWLWLWGPVGAFIAVPSLLIGSIVVDRLAGRATTRSDRMAAGHQPGFPTRLEKRPGMAARRTAHETTTSRAVELREEADVAAGAGAGRAMVGGAGFEPATPAV
jgi:predicted PurR-regulated permease PerM